MIFIRPILSFLVVFPVNYVQGLRPDGEHVCLVTENYDEHIVKRDWKPVTEIVKTWCWEIVKGFKCNKAVTKWKMVDIPQTIKRSRIVPQCCSGYKEDINLSKCVPSCKPKCINGYCTAPQTCTCLPGFKGLTCNISCSSGSWGINCFEKCNCQNSEICDIVTGECPVITTTTEIITSTSNDNLKNETSLLNSKILTTETTLETTTTTTTTTQSKVEEIQTKVTDQTTPENNQTTEQSVITISENEAINTIQKEEVTITTTENMDGVNSTTQKIEEHISTEEIVTTTQKVDEEFNTEKIKEMKTTSETTQKIGVYSKTSTKPTETTTEAIQSNFSNTAVIEVIFNEKEVEEKETEVEEKETIVESPIFTTDGTNIIEPDFQWKENEFIRNRAAEDLTNSDTILNDQNKRMKIVHFVPSLTVLTGVCILLFIIATRYIILRKKRKAQKEVLENQEKLFPSREVQRDSVFTVNNFGENPVYLPEELNNRTPVLQTFKPLNADTNSPKTNETTFR